MKFIERATLIIFSIIMLTLSIIACLLIFGWINIDFINSIVVNIISGQTSMNIVLGVSVLFILLAIKAIFFSYSSNEMGGNKEGVLLENESGKLLISKDTLENLVNNVTRGFEATENVTTKVMLDKENNIRVFVTLFIYENAVIKDLSANLQKRIKETIKRTSDLDVKEIDIKIKNITQKEKGEE